MIVLRSFYLLLWLHLFRQIGFVANDFVVERIVDERVDHGPVESSVRARIGVDEEQQCVCGGVCDVGVAL